MWQKLIRGIGYVLNISRHHLSMHRWVRHQTCHYMDGSAIQRQSVFYRRRNACPKFILTPRQSSDPTLTRIPITRRRIKQSLGQVIFIQFPSNNICGMCIREQEFHSLKARILGCLESIQERDFSKHHSQIGRKIWHIRRPCLFRREAQFH